MFDSEGYKKRLNELLGDRAPQFISAVITLCNADANLTAAVRQAPQTVIQAALKAASYDLPVDNALGFAYIVPFNNSKKTPDGNVVKVAEAQFILGYKGMIQLALRTGAYKRLNVMDVREGELVSCDRLTEDFEFNWEQDEEVREKLAVIGYVGYYRLVNGTEKTIYMSVQQIEAHEAKNRKGKYQGKGWRDDWDSMARKTVMRRLLGRWGVMSIDYKSASPAAIQASRNISSGLVDDDSPLPEGIVDVTNTGTATDVPPKSEAPKLISPEERQIMFDMANVCWGSESIEKVKAFCRSKGYDSATQMTRADLDEITAAMNEILEQKEAQGIPPEGDSTVQ